MKCMSRLIFSSSSAFFPNSFHFSSPIAFLSIKRCTYTESSRSVRPQKLQKDKKRNASVDSAWPTYSLSNKRTDASPKHCPPHTMHAGASAQPMPAKDKLPKQFDELPLSRALKERLKALSFVNLNVLQQQTFFPLLNGKNMAVRSQTGTGKTMAYVLPILQRIENEQFGLDFPIVIITPTRELAEQLAFTIYRLRHSKKLEVCILYGGSNEGGDEIDFAASGAHILIGTPARLRDALKRCSISLKSVKMLVVDEVDELISRGFDDDLESVLKSCNPHRQTAVFSATFPDWLREKIFHLFRINSLDTFADEPIFVDLVQQYGYQLSKNVKHCICRVPRHESKRARILAYIIEELCDVEDKVIVFCSTRNEATLLHINPWVYGRSQLLHSELPQHQRRAALINFRKKVFPVLIASDLASRGLDIEGVSLVLHYSPPLSAEYYIHRSGRAGRGDKKGKSIIFYDSTQYTLIRDLETAMRFRFENHTTPSDEAMRNKFFDRIEEELKYPIGVDQATFGELAKQQLEIHGPRLLAAILVLLGRRKYFQTWQSALSGRYGYTPLLFFDPFYQKITSRSKLLQLLKNCLPFGQFCKIGRIALTQRGYVVDMPGDVARQVLASEELKQSSVHTTYVSNLPPIISNELHHRIQKWTTPKQALYKLSERLKRSNLSTSTKRRLLKRVARQKERHAIQAMKVKARGPWVSKATSKSVETPASLR